MKNRTSNIELLRILASLGVMILHWNYNGGISLLKSVNPGGYYIFLLLECINICAVNVFMLISGYYMCKTKTVSLWKPVEIITQVILIKIFTELMKVVFLHKRFSIGAFVPNNYYVIFYIAVLLISPLLNTAMENATNKKRLIISLLLLFSVYPTLVDITGIQDLSSVTRTGSMDGYTIVNFVLMYMIGAYIREMEETIKSIKTSLLLGTYVFCLLCLFLWTVYAFNTAEFSGGGTCLSYANPLVILEAVLVFLLIRRIDIGSNKYINGLAKASFTAYLFHGAVIRYFVSEKFCSQFWGVTVIYVIISVLGIYAASWIVYSLYNLIMKNIFSICKRHITLHEWYY